MISQQEKKDIAEKLQTYVNNAGSQNAAAKKLDGISGATISHVLSGKWETIAESMWRNIAAQVGYNTTSYQHADTSNSLDLSELLKEAQLHSSRFSIISVAGYGKSTAAKAHVKENKNTFHIECGQYWDCRFFLQEILSKLGVNTPSNRISEMMREIVSIIRKLENPQLIIDEVDKLDDKAFMFLITFYNELHHHCSLVVMATHYLKKRINDGVRLQKKGYAEIKSRFGRYYELVDTSRADITSICKLNNVNDDKIIHDIAIKSKGDLRVVRDLIEAFHIDDKRTKLAS